MALVAIPSFWFHISHWVFEHSNGQPGLPTWLTGHHTTIFAIWSIQFQFVPSFPVKIPFNGWSINPSIHQPSDHNSPENATKLLGGSDPLVLLLLFQKSNKQMKTTNEKKCAECVCQDLAWIEWLRNHRPILLVRSQLLVTQRGEKPSVRAIIRRVDWFPSERKLQCCSWVGHENS